MTKLEEWVLPNGYRLEQHWIEGADNPRDDDEFKFTFYGFPHRNYKIGDETLDPGDVSEPCPAGCSEGTVWAENGQDVNECRRCDGRGEINPTNLDELMEMVGRRDNARLVRPVTMIDHSEVSYRLGRGAWACDPGGWDSGTCGIIVATWAQLEGRGGREWAEALSDETIEEWMSDEIDTYSAWAEGAVYEVLVFDPNGDEAEGAFDGWWAYGGDQFDELLRQAIAAVSKLEPPVKLYDVPRMTAAEILTLEEHLLDVDEDAAESAYDKLHGIKLEGL